jgi:type I restriction enzyme S subunit
LPVDLKFYHILFNELKDEIVRNTKAGTSKEAIGLGSFGKYELPYFDIDTQIEIKNKFVNSEEIKSSLTTELNQQVGLVKKLRQQLLQDAVQGKLVEQNKKDEPASELLKRIKAEKVKLITEKKLKKEKELPPVKSEEIPFEIPENWVWCRLGDAAILKRGKSKHRPRNDNSLFENGTHPFIQTGDVARSKTNGYLIETINGYYNDFGLAQSLMQKKGTLCITIAANIAECGFLGFDACAPDSIVCLSSLDKTIEKYCFYYIIQAREDIEKYAPATAQKNINLEILNSLLIPFPPLAEQHRIVQKLDELMQFFNELEESIKQIESQNEKLLRQVLREALRKEPVEV